MIPQKTAPKCDLQRHIQNAANHLSQGFFQNYLRAFRKPELSPFKIKTIFEYSGKLKLRLIQYRKNIES